MIPLLEKQILERDELDPECAKRGYEGTGTDQHFFLSISGLDRSIKIRDLRAEEIGRLTAITGTVTRTSDIHPELTRGYFRCGLCGRDIPDVV